MIKRYNESDYNLQLSFLVSLRSLVYILLVNNHLGNIFAEVIAIKTLFASAKPSAIADCRGEFRGLS